MDGAPIITGGIGVTDAAFAQLGTILGDEGEAKFLRVAVLGGGCSGFQYDYKIVGADAVEADDLVLEKDGARVLIDATSQEYMPGARIDYAEELIAAAFKIDNPIAASGCGCGTSFSL